MPQRKLNLRFPALGLERKVGYENQAPFSSPSLENVRIQEIYQDRERGGSRPGSGKAFVEELGGGSKVNLLEEVTVTDDSGFRVFAENFNVTALDDNGWSAVPSYSSNLPAIYNDSAATISYDVLKGGAIRDALDPELDSTQIYTVEMEVAPFEGSFAGKYQLWAAANDTTPDPFNEGLVAELVMTDATDAYAGTLYHYKGGVLDASFTFTAGGGSGNAKRQKFWFLINGSSVKVYWGNALLTSQTLTLTSPTTHRRVGFGIEATVPGTARVDLFQVQYQADTLEESRRDIVVAGSNGNLYRETRDGNMELVVSNLSINSDLRIRGQSYQSKLYIADRGDTRASGDDGVLSGGVLSAASIADWSAIGLDTYNYVVVFPEVAGATVAGTYEIASIAAGGITLGVNPGDGTAVYRIERGPKIYDPVLNTLELWVATTDLGQVPTGSDNIARYRGRLVLSRQNLWSMSRQYDPLDWDFGASDIDYGRAVAGINAAAGDVGEDIKALMPHNDDYIMFGCQSSIWILRGDAAFPGATLGPVTQNAGVVGGDAWTSTDRSEIIILADSGVHVIPPGAEGFPVMMSTQLPKELKNLTDDRYQVSLEYDRRERGLHIFVYQEGVTQGHWWMEWKSDQPRGFFPVSLPTTQTPFCTISHSKPVQDSTHVMTGCKDGYIRFFDDAFNTDDGEEIESHIELGPFRIGNGFDMEGFLRDMTGVLGSLSGSVDWSIRTGKSAEEAYRGTTLDSGTWDNPEGVQLSDRLNLRGMAAILRLENSGLDPWGMEYVTLRVEALTNRRMLG